MDPFSIITGVASLVGPCVAISSALYRIINEIGRVRSTILALHNEINSLSECLKSISTTFRNCDTLAVRYVDDELWRCIQKSMEDCQSTLQSLKVVVHLIQGDSETAGLPATRPAILRRLSLRSEEIKGLQDRVHNCSQAMKMACQVINVSLSLRSNNSQDQIFRELRKLKILVESSLRFPFESPNSNTEALHDAAASSNSIISLHLRNLAQAANSFHSSATFSASTVAGSDAGDLTDLKRENINRWMNDLGAIDETMESGSEPISMSSRVPSSQDHRYLHVSEEFSYDVEKKILTNIMLLARKAVQEGDFITAESMLREQLDAQHRSPLDLIHFESLSIQLALICCNQNKWEDAAHELEELVMSRTCENVELYHILRAVSLAHAQAENYEAAFSTGILTAEGMRRIFGEQHQNYLQALEFQAKIFEKQGLPFKAQALRCAFLTGFVDNSEQSPHEYLKKVFDSTGENQTRNSNGVPPKSRTPRASWQQPVLQPERRDTVIGNVHERLAEQVDALENRREFRDFAPIVFLPDTLHRTNASPATCAIDHNIFKAEASPLSIPDDQSSNFSNAFPPEFLDPLVSKITNQETKLGGEAIMGNGLSSSRSSKQPRRIESEYGRQQWEVGSGKEFVDAIVQDHTLKHAVTDFAPTHDQRRQSEPRGKNEAAYLPAHSSYGSIKPEKAVEDTLQLLEPVSSPTSSCSSTQPPTSTVALRRSSAPYRVIASLQKRLRASSRSVSEPATPLQAYPKIASGAILPIRPTAANNFCGFCQGAWAIREDPGKGLSPAIKPCGIHTTLTVWRCKSCGFEGQVFTSPIAAASKGKRVKQGFDPRVHSAANGRVHFTWIFLAKSHVKKKRPMQDPISHPAQAEKMLLNGSSFGCIFCVTEFKPTSIFDDVEKLADHLMRNHSTMTEEVRTRCRASVSKDDNREDWDVQIL